MPLIYSKYTIDELDSEIVQPLKKDFGTRIQVTLKTRYTSSEPDAKPPLFSIASAQPGPGWVFPLVKHRYQDVRNVTSGVKVY